MEIVKTFKHKEELQKWLECELLLAECQAYQTKTIKEFKDSYKKEVVEKAKALGLEMRGKTVANS